MRFHFFKQSIFKQQTARQAGAKLASDIKLAAGFLLICSSLLFSGCAQQGGLQPSMAKNSSQLAVKKTSAKNFTGLDAALIETFLLAEILGQQAELNLASHAYTSLAIATQDAQVAQRATWISQFAQEAQLSQLNAVLWAQLETENPEAQGAAAGFLLNTSQVLEALDYLIAYEKLGGRSNYTLLVKHATSADLAEVEAIYARLQQEESQRQETSADLSLSVALLAFALDEPSLSQDYLNKVLEVQPKNQIAQELQLQLLYQKALEFFRQGDYAAMEQNLRQILQQDPESATALNALGYMLVDKTSRLEEGLALLEQAIALKPEAPEILDSLGWALYKLGRAEEALPYLEQAYELLPDAEIEAHLLEVLKAQEEQEEAK